MLVTTRCGYNIALGIPFSATALSCLEKRNGLT
jgi:hypothetical protein